MSAIPLDLDDSDLTTEIAALFARGIFRLRNNDLKIASESAAGDLALCSESCPLVVDAQESNRKEHKTWA